MAAFIGPPRGPFRPLRRLLATVAVFAVLSRLISFKVLEYHGTQNRPVAKYSSVRPSASCMKKFLKGLGWFSEM
jgi:hypothetical protein